MKNNLIFQTLLVLFSSLILFSCVKNDSAVDSVKDVTLKNRTISCDGEEAPEDDEGITYTKPVANPNGNGCCVTVTFDSRYSGHNYLARTYQTTTETTITLGNGTFGSLTQTYCIDEGDNLIIEIRDPNSSCPSCVVSCTGINEIACE